MQIKIFNVPIPGGEQMNEEMNRFLRSKKVLQVQNHIVNADQGAFWCFCVKYLDEYSTGRKKEKVDYREVLDEASFKRFSRMREIRKKVAQQEAIPAYAVFTNEELAELAKIEHLTEAKMRGIKGVGKNKVSKYGHYFIDQRLIRKFQKIEEKYHSGEWSEAACQRHILPLLAFIRHADTKTFRENVILGLNFKN